MGYTHYWNFKPTDLKDWEAKIADCDKIIAACKDRFALDLDGSNETRIWLNGSGDDAHETFDMPRTLAEVQSRVDNAPDYRSDGMEGFDFCKTARKPYDDVVVACLCVMAETGLDVSSDGYRREWEDGRKLAQEVLGRPVANPIEDEDES